MIRGTYKTKRDGGIEYTYEASCGMYGEDCMGAEPSGATENWQAIAVA